MKREQFRIFLTRQQRNDTQPALVLERFKAALRPFRLYRAARFGWHFATDPTFRHDHLLLWRRPKNLFQHRSITVPDRYPQLFRFIRDQLDGRPNLRLLSFGCAMGDEVFSLREYFPNAFIKGIDINAANITTCLRRHRTNSGDPALAFEANDSAAAEPAGSYDAIFCLAVFVRWRLKEDRAIVSCVPHLRFAQFERAVTTLAAAVKPGGFLALRHSMFRFCDTAAARDFRPVLRLPGPAEFFPRFGPDDRRLPDAPEEETVFQKIEPASRRG
jgi:hypothetical protein